ncbi:MAG: hypothetical protein NTZ68_02275 [Candidatus Dependentiae bacterium]|nr:hypothetical protein [Candidatus Dependentiae bacterium]
MKSVIKSLGVGIFFLLGLSCLHESQATLVDDLFLAIEKVDAAVTGGREVLPVQMQLIDHAILCRFNLFPYSSYMEHELHEAKGLYLQEFGLQPRNHMTEVFIGQAIVAFLYGNGPLGEKYMVHFQKIKKQYENKNKSLVDAL